MFLSKINCVRNLFDLVSGARNNGKTRRVSKGYTQGGCVSLRSFLFYFFYICFILYPLKCIFFCLYPQTNHLYSILALRLCELSPWPFDSRPMCYGDDNIKHYDLHSNWNEISNRAERCRRDEMYSELFFYRCLDTL